MHNKKEAYYKSVVDPLTSGTRTVHHGTRHSPVPTGVSRRLCPRQGTTSSTRTVHHGTSSRLYPPERHAPWQARQGITICVLLSLATLVIVWLEVAITLYRITLLETL